MFGSDWPVCKKSCPDESYARQIYLVSELTKHLSDEDRNKIFYQNALDFYGLNV